jgi:hypothetical protein
MWGEGWIMMTRAPRIVPCLAVIAIAERADSDSLDHSGTVVETREQFVIIIIKKNPETLKADEPKAPDEDFLWVEASSRMWVRHAPVSMSMMGP